MTQQSFDFSSEEEDSSEDVFTLEDLNHVWMEDGLPLFFDDYENICEIVESLGFSIYYVLGNKATEIKPEPPKGSTVVYNSNSKPYTPPTPIIKRSTNIFKIVNNFVGRSVSIAQVSLPQTYLDFEEEATYNMPPIPHVLVDKLDQFFRLIDAQHGTESIVMLTYDINKQDSDGWGILVPDQFNTSVHCNYDPDSIAQVKPDDVIIVGSVHSHPGMAAYASGTDHADQADFDGIHITFGWQKSVNNGATQYYAELQMAGKAYKLDIEDVFEDYIVNKAPDPDVVEWTDKVKKVLPPSTVGGHSSHKTNPTQEHKQSYTQLGIIPDKVPTKSDLIKWKDILKALQISFQVEDNAYIVAEVDFDLLDPNPTSFCPCCGTVIDDYDMFNNSCDSCYIPLIQKNTPVESIFEEMMYFFKRHNLDSKVPIYLWGSTEDKAEFLIKITPETLYHSAMEYDSSPTESDKYVYGEDIHITSVENIHTLCCNQTYENALVTCICEPQIINEDLRNFDNYTKSIHLYDGGSQCSSCQFYYDPACPAYMNLLKSFVQNENFINIDLTEESINGVNCNTFLSYDNSYAPSFYYDGIYD